MAENRQIYTAFNVSGVPLQPSMDCVQWSGDGQIIVTNKNAIYVLTPDLGVSFDSLSLAKSATVGEKRGTASVDLGWFKNVIELDRGLQHFWAGRSQELGSLALGAMDNSCRMATISPSNITPEAGSLLVTLSTNMEVFVWRSMKNHLKGVWTKMQDISALLKDLPPPQTVHALTQERQAFLQVLQAQINCVSWSPQADFGLTPNPLLDASMFALGNRAGSVIVMRYDGNQSLQFITVIRVADVWVTRLSWRSWMSQATGQSESILACGLADGSIKLVKVSQKLEQLTSLSPFGCNNRIQCDFVPLDVQPAPPDGKGITALTWIEAYTPTLAYSKPGQLYLYRQETSNPTGDIQPTVLLLRTQKQSAGSSSLTQPSGLCYIKKHDVLIATLSDGSFHVVHNISGQPTLDIPSTDDGLNEDTWGVNSENLSRNARAMFVKSEGGSMKFADVNKIDGAASFDGMGTFVWLHEACRPSDFSYKPDARQSSMFIVAPLWNCSDREWILRHLRDLLTNAESGLGHAPIHVLRPLILQLRNPQAFDTLRSRILDVLREMTTEEHLTEKLVNWSGEVNGDLRAEFRHSLARHLFGLDSLYRCRLKFAVADTCFKLCQVEQSKQEFGEVAFSTQIYLARFFLFTIINHGVPLIDALSENEVPFLVRVIVQCLLPGSPAFLQSEANALMSALETRFSATSPDAFKLSEPCPACSAEVHLEDLRTAVCPNRHTWVRCAITSFILSTPMVRNCIGCSRKAFLPPSVHLSDPAAGPPSWLPRAGQTWIVEELLEAVRTCVYCGNRFVRVT